MKSADDQQYRITGNGGKYATCPERAFNFRKRFVLGNKRWTFIGETLKGDLVVSSNDLPSINHRQGKGNSKLNLLEKDKVALLLTGIKITDTAFFYIS